MPRRKKGPPGSHRTTLTQQARQRKAKEIEQERKERAATNERRAYSKHMNTYERQLADLEPERYLRMVENRDLTYDAELVALAKRRLGS